MTGNLIKRSQFLFIGSFVTLIAVGSLLLLLPGVMRYGSLDWLDAVFTATSATCVTGLLTVPLTEFTRTGQVIVLLLIQLGGLGIMSMSAFLVLLSGKSMNWSNTMMMSSLNDDFNRRSTESMVRAIVIFTFAVELGGFVLLFCGFFFDGGYALAEALYYALFHTVSAFCNAGISPFADSICSFSSYNKLVLTVLILLGGFGVYAVYDIVSVAKSHRQFSVNTKVIIATNIILVAAGMIGLWAFQYMDRQSITWVDALFQSVSARTAGFNSVEMGNLSLNSTMTIIILMLVGGSPGSTAGGIKVTTFALVAVALWNTLKGNTKVLLFKREIPLGNVLKAFTMLVVFLLLVAVGVIVFGTLMPGDILNLREAIFETTSALCTCGLSLGTTNNLNFEAKWFIISYMFIGRVGPLTFLLFLLGREKNSHLTYPEDRIVIG